MSDERIESHEERIYVLRDKAAREGFSVPDDALEYIAEKYAMSTTLKGALINVAAYAHRRGLAIDRAMCALVLDGVRPEVERPEPTGEAAEQHDPAVDDVVGTAASEGGADEYPFEPDGTLFGGGHAPEPVAASASSDTDVQQPAETAPLQPPGEPELPPFVSAAPPEPLWTPAQGPASEPMPTPAPEPEQAPQPTPPPAYAPESAPAPGPAPAAVSPREPSVVWFAPVRSVKKESLVKRVGSLLKRVGLDKAIDDGDLVAIKMHFGEEGNTGFVHPVFVREVVRRVRKHGGKPFLTDSNTLYRGKRANSVDHLTCAVRNGFSFSTVNAPIIIADGLTGGDGVEVPIEGYKHFDTVKIGAAAAQADAMVVVSHVKGHEATGFGGAIKNIGMGLGTRAAKQRMHSDLKPQVNAEKCTACKRCVKSCPVYAIRLVDKVAVIDYELCYGCGECVAACAYGAIGIQWKTEPHVIQEKIVEHCAGALAEKDGKVVYLSFVTNVSPDCDCWSFTDAAVVADIGVLASTDLVAIDQAAYDLVVKANGLPGSRGEGLGRGVDKFREITGVDGTIAMRYAEERGLGTRAYELRTLE